jgi:riboflavin synthase
MFTGIVETLGRVENIEAKEGNVEWQIRAPFTSELKVDQSVSHNGACLTVTKIADGNYFVTIIQETLKKTTLGKLKIGDFVNLERSMPANGRFDGHIVQGHVDTVGICKEIRGEKGSHILTIEHDNKSDFYTVEKGSICLNGISLTVINSKQSEFSVAIIPYTFDHTNIKYLKVGDGVNLEFDILGKYIKKILNK